MNAHLPGKYTWNWDYSIDRYPHIFMLWNDLDFKNFCFSFDAVQQHSFVLPITLSYTTFSNRETKYNFIHSQSFKINRLYAEKFWKRRPTHSVLDLLWLLWFLPLVLRDFLGALRRKADAKGINVSSSSCVLVNTVCIFLFCIRKGIWLLKIRIKPHISRGQAANPSLPGKWSLKRCVCFSSVSCLSLFPYIFCFWYCALK